jgi:hypothetical protein
MVQILLGRNLFLLKSLSMTKTEVNLSLGNEIDVFGTVGNLYIRDYDNNSSYQEILGTTQKLTSLVEFEYHTIKPKNEYEPNYTKFINLKMNSVKMVYLQRLLNKLYYYFIEGPLIKALQEGKFYLNTLGSKKAAQISIEVVKSYGEQINLLKLNLEFTNPLVVCPVNYQSSDRLIGDLGLIKLENKLIFTQKDEKNWTESYNLTLKDMNLKSIISGFIYLIIRKAKFNY